MAPPGIPLLLVARRTTIRLQRRHLARHTGIQQWMRASPRRWRRRICMAIHSAPSPASTIGCGFAGDAAVQAERDHAIVAQLPEPSVWIPRPTGRFTRIADHHVGEGDA